MKWCDFYCEHADTQGTECATGGCRREIAVYCKKFKKLVNKNSLCIEVQREMLAKDEEFQRRYRNAPEK